MRIAALVLLGLGLIAAPAAGGEDAEPPLVCPPGSELRGESPPRGRALACERPGPDGRSRRHGPAREWDATGVKLLEGEYRDGAMHGRFRFWNHSGELMAEVEFRDGLPIWAEPLRCPPGTRQRSLPVWPGGENPVERGLWIQVACVRPTADGSLERHGPVREWYPSGQRRSEGRYEKGLPEGPTLLWYESGQPAMAGSYAAGQPDGHWNWWRESGEKRLEGSYRAGVREGVWTHFHEGGGRAETGLYRHGKKSGLWTRFRPDGSKLEEAEYRNDELHGRRTTWFEDGSLRAVEEYEGGRWRRTLEQRLRSGRVVPVDEEACRAAGGTWGRFGLLEREECDLPAADAGRRCRSGEDCEGDCVAPEAARGRVEGRCSERTILRGSCPNRVRNGEAAGPACED